MFVRLRLPGCPVHHCRNALVRRQRALTLLVPRIADSAAKMHSCFVKQQHMPVFGVRNTSLPQKARACAYAVITNADGLIAAVQENPGKMYLPGGGMELSETPAQAVHREVREELGRAVRLTGCIGQSLHYFDTEGHCQATYATFFSAELGDQITTDHERHLEWVPAEELFHASQAWAALHCMVTIASA
jgi:8-oxo-dGTP diphosphatase